MHTLISWLPNCLKLGVCIRTESDWIIPNRSESDRMDETGGWKGMYICMHACGRQAYGHTYVHMHTRMYVRTYVCMYVSVCMCICMCICGVCIHLYFIEHQISPNPRPNCLHVWMLDLNRYWYICIEMRELIIAHHYIMNKLYNKQVIKFISNK